MLFLSMHPFSSRQLQIHANMLRVKMTSKEVVTITDLCFYKFRPTKDLKLKSGMKILQK